MQSAPYQFLALCHQRRLSYGNFFADDFVFFSCVVCFWVYFVYFLRFVAVLLFLLVLTSQVIGCKA